MTTFYATPTGARYHRHWFCTGLNGWAAATWDEPVPEVSRAEILARGLAPCRTCGPPPVTGLRVV